MLFSKAKVQNTLKYAWRSKLSIETTWGDWSEYTQLELLTNNFYINDLSLGTIYATNSSYDFQFKFVDELGNLDASKVITTATQNVTISTPIVEIYEDEVNVNGNVLKNNIELPLALNNYSESTKDTYSCNYANSHFKVYQLWSGDIVPTDYNVDFTGTFSGNRPYDFQFCFVRFVVNNSHFWFPFKSENYAEGRHNKFYCGITSTENAYLSFYYGGYGGFNAKVTETQNISLSNIHLMEIIGINKK